MIPELTCMVTLYEGGADRQEGCEHFGRLILNKDGLFFIHGWSRSADATPTGRGFMGLLGSASHMLANSKIYAAIREDGVSELERVAHVPPADQVRLVPSSMHIEVDDIERIWFKPYRYLFASTKLRGAQFCFLLPTGVKKRAKAWARALGYPP